MSPIDSLATGVTLREEEVVRGGEPIETQPGRLDNVERRQILKNASLLGATGVLALVTGSEEAHAQNTEDDDGAIRWWKVRVIIVTNPGALYTYFYAFAHGVIHRDRGRSGKISV